MLLGTVSRNERFHEAPVEILQRVTRCLAQATGASLELMPDIGKPDAANYSQFGAQLCGRTAWMRVQKILYVLSDDRRQFFDLDVDHIQKTHADAFWISKLCRTPQYMHKSEARTRTHSKSLREMELPVRINVARSALGARSALASL